MQKKFGLEISILLVIMMIMTSFVSALNITPFVTTNQSNFNPLNTVADPYPQFDAYKQVWNGSAWADEYTVPIGTIVRFNITVEYHDIDLLDNCYKVSEIEIIDNLSDFEYIGNPSISENGINPDNYLTFNPVTHIYKWYFSDLITLSEKLTFRNKTLYLEFDAKANTTGTLINNVNVSGIEHCCYRPCSSEANATVIVGPKPFPAVILTKYVKENTNWVKNTSVNIGDTVTFRLLINNTGNIALTNVKVTDELPPFLFFNNDANITPATFNNHHIEWNLGTLTANQIKEIVFSVHATASGESDNFAIVTTAQGPTDDDTAHIIVLPQGNLRCTKTVWDSITQKWVEQINADIGDTVRFNITLTYYGTDTLANITVVDTLPAGLQYANNASSVETAKNNKIIYWNLSNILTNGQSISIKFNASVISSGTNINTANITGTENCCTPLYCEDTASVKVEETPPLDQDLRCEKQVWDPGTQQWAEEINAEIGNTVRFKITVSYWGSLAFYYIWINDTLPTCLQYNNTATPYQPVLVNGKAVSWYLPLFLRYGQNISLEFNALVISEGVNINKVNITGWECGIHRLYCEDTATVIVKKTPSPELHCNKTVWNPDTHKWVEQINADIGDTVRFNITLTYYGAVNLTNIKVVDTLPACLQYANNASPVETAKNNKIIYWNLSNILTNGQSISIKFNASVISSGTNINTANITGYVNCTELLYCEDTATVIVKEPPSNLTCEKKVWNPDTKHWVEQINADIGDTVRFNITLTYTGNGTFSNIHVTDILPACLQYADNASPVETAKNNNSIIFWNLSNILKNGQRISIEFNASVISSGTNINTANITGFENCTLPLYCEDTATVIVEKPQRALECEKKVWDPGTKHWVEQINANVTDTVRFKINLSYWGSLAFYNIWVNDTLPTCLQYNNNATPYQPEINGKKVIWHLNLTLKYGQNISLEFNALVISSGQNVNMVNITGIECGIRRLFCEDTATVLVVKQPDPIVAQAGGPYTGYVNESIQMTGSATGGVAPYTYTWDFNNDGVYNDGVGVNPTYTWRAPGTYTIHLKVNDTAGKNNTDSAQVTVNIRNSPPNKPSTPEGPASGKTKKVLTYSSGAVDPNGDQIYLLFDWGDGNTSGWLGPFNSGTAHTANHTWTVKGSYNIKVKAKDTHSEESAWSDPLTISITRRISAEYTTPTIIESIKNRFPALENLITTLLNIIETMRLNHTHLL